MNEQTKIRLSIITTRHAKRIADAGGDAGASASRELAFRQGFARARAEILRPAMTEIGGQLERSGHGYRVAEESEGARPSIEFHLLITGARLGAKNVIRFFSRDVEKGPEIIAEVEMMRSPIELTRYWQIEAMTPEVIEQLLLDAIEQVFANNS